MYFHPYFKKLFPPIIAVLILLAGLSVFLKVVRQRQSDPKASTNLVDLLISAPADVSYGQEFSSTISVDPHNYKVAAIDLKVNVSSNLELISIQPGTYSGIILSAAEISSNSARIVLGSGPTPARGAGVLVTLIFKTKADTTGTAQIIIDPDTAIAGIDVNGFTVPASILGSIPQVNIVVNSPTPTSTPPSHPRTKPFLRDILEK